MAAQIGDLAVRVGADITDLKSGFDKAAAKVKRFSARSSKNIKKVAKATTVLTAGVGGLTTAMVALQKSSADTARAIINLSTVANTSTTEFQKLAFGAKEYGIENEKLADILKDVNDRIGDFVQTGGGPMKDFFEFIAPQVGVTVEQFKKLSGPEALQLYISSLEKANLSQADMVFFMEAMASDATNLLPLFKENGKELERLSKAADDFGAVISSEDLTALAGAQKQFAQMEAAIRSAKVEISSAFLPELESVKKIVVDISKTFTGFIRDISAARKEAEKQAEVDRKINEILGARKKSVRDIRRGQSSDAEKLNSLMLRQIEIEEQLSAQFVKRTGQGRRSNRNRLEQFEQRKIALIAEQEENQKIIDQLALQSEKAAEIKSIREGIVENLKEDAAPEVSPEVKPKDDSLDRGTIEALEGIKQRFLTEQELMREHRETMALIGEEYDARKFESEEEWRKVKEQAEAEHLRRLEDLNIQSMTKLERFNAMSWTDRVKTVSGALSEMTQGVAQHSKAMFRINQIAGISEAVINTSRAITQALAAYPPPLSFGMAAAQAAAGAAQIGAIKSASFSGGGGPAPSVAGSAASGAANASTASAPAPAQQQTLTIAPIDPDAIFSGASVQSMSERIYDFTKDGGKVVFAQ